MGVDDDDLALECLNIAFTRMFSLSVGKHLMNYVSPKPKPDEELRDEKRFRPTKSTIDLRVLSGMIQAAYGWMLFELVFDQVGDAFELKRLRVNPRDRTIYVKVSCKHYD